MSLFSWGSRSQRVKTAEELLAECCERLDVGEKRLSRSAREWIARRRWNDDPNEMRRAVYYAVLTSKDELVEAVHFPPSTAMDHEALADSSFEMIALEELVDHKVGHFFERLGKVEGRGVYRTVLKQFERPLIKRCLDWAEGNQLKAARVLGINRNTLRKKVKELGIK